MLLHRLRSLFVPQVCPHCWEKFPLKTAGFRCSNLKCKVRAIDPVLREKWNRTEKVGKLLPPAGPWKRSQRCDAPDCGKVTTRRICPHCHMELPATTGLCPNLIFAIIGAKAAGKSHYIATLLEELRRRVGPALDLLLEPLDDRTIQRYREVFYTPLYVKKTTIDPTISGLNVEGLQLPMVFNLKQGGTDLFGRRIIRRSITLVFFDTAGEDLNAEDTMATVNKYIALADGLIVLLDPLQLPSVRDQLGMQPSDPPVQNAETLDILIRTARLIRAVHELDENAILSVPLAVVFSKFDAVKSLAPDLQLHQPSNHQHGFNTDDFAGISAEMESQLINWDRGGEGLLQQVRTSFRTAGYFGISALGEPPRGSHLVREPLPRRVEDPFLWLLYHHGFLKGRAGQ